MKGWLVTSTPGRKFKKGPNGQEGQEGLNRKGSGEVKGRHREEGRGRAAACRGHESGWTFTATTTQWRNGRWNGV